MNAVSSIFFLLIFMAVNLRAQTTVQIGPFTELDVTDKLNVTFIPSQDNYVAIEGELADKVEVIQKSDKLRIKMAGGYPLKGANTFISIYAPHIKRFTVQKGAIVQTEGHKVQADSLTIWVNEGGKIDVEIEAGHVDVNSTTGGIVALRGTSETQSVNLTFGGNYYGEGLQAKRSIARVNGGGQCEMRSSVSVDAQTRAGGAIKVYGNPSERKQRRFAGGKILFID